MAGFRVDFSQVHQLDSNSDVLSGCRLFVYENETTLAVTLYSDRDALITASNPITADSSGRLPTRYVADDDLLTLTLKTSADVAVWSVDDFEPLVSTDLAALAALLPLAGGTMLGPLNFKEGAAIASATSINLDAATGNFIHITGTTGISTMTLAAGAHRWLVFDAAVTLTHSANLILPGSLDITTVAGDCALVVGEGSGVTRLLWYRCVDGKPLFENADFQVAASDETTNLTTGTAKVTFRTTGSLIISSIPRASLSVAQAAGSALTIDVNAAGASILTTKLTFDNSELTTTTATTPATLTTSPTIVADNAEWSVDIDAVGTSGARGLKVTVLATRRNR